MSQGLALTNQSDAQSEISKADSQTAQEYIAEQLQLEADAKEALPYQFDTCTKPLGPLRQSLFSCLTCRPPPKEPNDPYVPAGVCYSCSISCHGEHELVELFSKRDFECDCGTTRFPESAPCNLRNNPSTGLRGGVVKDEARSANRYNHNFKGRFCGCGDQYDPHKEKGTMFQCLGLGHVEDSGCGEDWWHPECLLGGVRKEVGVPSGSTTESKTTSNREVGADTEQILHEEPPTENSEKDEAPLPPGFPEEDSFDHFICYKCVNSNPWIRQYAGTPGFLGPVYLESNVSQCNEGHTNESAPVPISIAKRKLDDDEDFGDQAKKAKIAVEVDPGTKASMARDGDVHNPDGTLQLRHNDLPNAPDGAFSIFVKDDFRDHLCRCPECFPRLSRLPQLLEEEEVYEPPVSESGGEQQGGSVGSRSLLDRGEAALSTVDRVRAIEGVMAYNNLRDKLKSFLKPFADRGEAVGAEEIKAYFARLRGDDEAMRQAASNAEDGGGAGNNRREQSGY